MKENLGLTNQLRVKKRRIVLQSLRRAANSRSRYRCHDKKSRRNSYHNYKTEIAEIINTNLDKLKKELKARDDKIAALEKENVALKTLLNNKAQSIENIEVYARVDNLLIQGIPVSYANVFNQSPSSDYASADVSSPNDETVFIDFCANQLDVLVSPGYISICHQLPKTPKAVHQPLLVRFTNRK